MTRDQLEADLWRAITYHRVTCDHPVALIEDLVKTALRWLTADGPEQQQARRNVLKASTR